MEIGTRHSKKAYFTNEPAFLTGGRFCVPKRWIEKKDGVGYAECLALRPVLREERCFWQAVASPVYHVPLDEFLKPFPELKDDMVDHPDF